MLFDLLHYLYYWWLDVDNKQGLLCSYTVIKVLLLRRALRHILVFA
jgi:hypothetical protein